MDKKFQVFISSTFEDLKEERRIAIEQILNLGHFPVGMELFQAGNQSQWSYIQRRIIECDYYIVLVAERYGSEIDGKSYTQLEYEFAVSNDVPVAAFLLDNDSRSRWPKDRVQFEKAQKIDLFRDLCQNKIVRFWRNADDLGSKITTTMVAQIRDEPRTGWVRGDTAATSAALSELAKLSEEKRILQEELWRLKSQTAQLTPPPDMMHRMKQLSEKLASDFITNFRGEYSYKGSETLLILFIRVYKHFSVGCSAWDASSLISNTIGAPETLDTSLVIAEFCSCNLLASTHVTSYSFNKPTDSVNLTLTDYGKDFAMHAEILHADLNT